MNKDDLKSIALHIYDELLNKINSEEILTKDQTVDYLTDLTNKISNTSNISKKIEKKSKDNYENIADKSISSYEHTNEKFEHLTKLHNEILLSCKKKNIDIPSIVEKLNNIQNQMINEIKEANKIIYELSNQVNILKKESNLDALTKVFNRRALSTHLENICSRKDDFKTNRTHLLILDIDDFKLVNDTYGHVTGDKILIFISNIIKKTLKNYNKIFRFGGEEFVVIFDNISYNETKAIAIKLLGLIRESKLIYKHKTINVTISIGSTTLLKDDTPDSLLARADKALYTAKDKGKDQMYSEIDNGI